MARKVKFYSSWDKLRDNITFILVIFIFLRDTYFNELLFKRLAYVIYHFIERLTNILL